MKIITLLLVCLVLVSCVAVVYYNNYEEVENNMEEIYQGPVPQGYDLEHFTKTGETIKIKDPKTGEKWDSIEDYRNRNLKT